jgi:translocation and assembly module TamB
MAGTQAPSFTYDIKIHTANKLHPVKLLTPQMITPIPVGIDLLLSSQNPLKGQIEVLRFPIELFRRQVTFDHLTLKLATSSPDNSRDTSLDGRIQVPYPDYTISILVLGTADKPQLKFMSDPPLPDDQIISVLIFGQSLDALSQDQQQSVGNSQAALRKGVFSLFSLYYLSSMNIESVDYDPDTHTASMRYHLAEGASLNVSEGIGGGQPSVAIRKRLGKNFAITTTLNSPSEQRSQRTVSSFLEWAYQY